MFTSCGIQWLAQVARYFSQAHLYLNGTSWLTSVWPLMMRLSAALTRRATGAVAGVAADGIAAAHRSVRTSSSARRMRGAICEVGELRRAADLRAAVRCVPQSLLQILWQGGLDFFVPGQHRKIQCSNYVSNDVSCKVLHSHRAPIMLSLCCSHASQFVRRCRERRVHFMPTSLARFARRIVDAAERDVGCRHRAQLRLRCEQLRLRVRSCLADASLPPDDTALSRPDCTVDFSACVALCVRR